MSLLEANFIYLFFSVILMIGLYATIAKRNLVKKLMGLSIFQTAIILFYVSIGYKRGADIPIAPAVEGAEVVAAHYVNPLPHVLMLTAIVVGVATVGVALALIERLYAEYQTVEEDEILKQIAKP